MITIEYSSHDSGPETEKHSFKVSTHEEACAIIDQYPLEQEIEWFRKEEEGCALYFILGDWDDRHVSYQFIPFDMNENIFDVEVVLKKGGFLHLGRKSLYRSFENISLPELKTKVKDLFLWSIEDFYNRYR